MKKNFLGIGVVILLFISIMVLFFTLYRHNYSIDKSWNMVNAETGEDISAAFAVNFEKDIFGSCKVSGSVTINGDTYTATESRSGEKTVLVKLESGSDKDFITARFDINAKFGGIYYNGAKYEGPAENKEQAAELVEKLVEDNTGTDVYDW